MAKWKIVAILLTGAVVLVFNADFFFSDLSEGTEVSKIGASISKTDRKRLEYFFRRLIFWDDGGYVLTGSKPCSIAAFQEPFGLNRHFLSSLTPSNFRFWLGWKTWKKYENHFPHPCFSLIREKQKNGTSVLIFINKQELTNVISSYIDEFENTLSGAMNDFFNKILNDNDFLMGILLGYGRNNAWLFSEGTKPLVSFIEPLERERFSSYILSQGIWGFATGSLFTDLSQWPLPGFSVDEELAETIYLKKKYTASRQTLIAYFSQRNFLDAALESLAKPLPEKPLEVGLAQRELPFFSCEQI